MTKRKLLIRIAVLAALVGAIATFAKLYPFEGVGEWTGIGKDSNKSVSTDTEINPKTKEVTKITKKETENFQSSKTLWDWLQLGGTIAIPFALLYFERTEQRRSDERAHKEKEQAEERAEREKEIADNNLREQALEAYIDRMSELLIDKKLKMLSGKNLERSHPEYPLLEADIATARARTLSVLRRLDQDIERKESVIRFLSDVELISNLDLNGANLESANLERANLVEANLEGANLEEANLVGAHLKGANLKGAKLKGAHLREANLVRANLVEANLVEANLEGVNLEGVNLEGVNLVRTNLVRANLVGASLVGAHLEGTYLWEVNLERANLWKANLAGASLVRTNLAQAKQINPEQVKSANNWELAKYDKEFRAKLGLPPEADE
ncbi:MAG: pentapeptide repeat-containing protein [Rhizonema sp. PD38]|nr:pentapeptide repeat-containing protein [Rhizonema sp. PD38]